MSFFLLRIVFPIFQTDKFLIRNCVTKFNHSLLQKRFSEVKEPLRLVLFNFLLTIECFQELPPCKNCVPVPASKYEKYGQPA